jgi:hypothetical protein
MGSLGGPFTKAAGAPAEERGGRQKNRQFLDKPADALLLFFRKERRLGSRDGRLRTRRSPVGGKERINDLNDSEMAPQTIGIDQNGLGNGNPPARCAKALLDFEVQSFDRRDHEDDQNRHHCGPRVTESFGRAERKGHARPNVRLRGGASAHPRMIAAQS